MVGNPLNISWHYDQFVNTARFPAKKVALYYQRADSVMTPDGWKVIDDKLPPSTRSYQWNVPPLQDGNYQIRYVIDDLDPQRPAATVGNCVPDTFPGPAMSQKFKIMNSLPLPIVPDTMGPNSGTYQSVGGVVVSVIAVICAALVLL